jgi:predicted metal-dependent phosphoesterase TrpH
MIDLHTHSRASDGSLSPRQLVLKAWENGVRTLGITDHDTTDGLPEALDAAASLEGFQIVPGVEFSAEYHPGTMHILGYFIDPEHAGLKSVLAEMRRRRNERNPRIVEALQKAGCPVTMEEVLSAAGGSSIGRPHIARILVEKGCVANVDEAFALWLDRGRPGFVPQARIESAEAIRTILSAGGVPVLAHPYQLRAASESVLEEIVCSLCESGLRGIEVWYSRHTPEMTESYIRLAQRYGLVCTGGSDFHGDPKPEIRLGTGTGNLHVPPVALTSLAACRDALRAES